MIILVVAIGIILIALNLKSIKSEPKGEFSNIIKRKEEEFTEVDLELGKIRKNMGESLTDLQLEIEELRDRVVYLEAKVIKLENSEKKMENKKDIGYNKEENIYIEQGVINEINFEKKSNKDDEKREIIKLIEEGKTDSEICELLKVGKGEVLLIKGLFK